MAERRMFSKKIIDTDSFLDMPVSTRLLYYDLSMRADDDGFIASPKKITRMVGCSEDDLKLLIAKQFIIPFESGICVIKDWRIHNYIRNDRYHPTQYNEEKSKLKIEENGSYTTDLTVGIPNDIPNVYQMDTEVRLGKDRLELGKKEEDTKASSSCAELSADAAPPCQKEPLISFPMNDKSEYLIFEEQAHEWAALYPAVDVIQQLRNMRGWLLANPKKRKTKTGVNNFINGWLSREQNKGGCAPAHKSSAKLDTREVLKKLEEKYEGV